MDCLQYVYQRQGVEHFVILWMRKNTEKVACNVVGDVLALLMVFSKNEKIIVNQSLEQ